MSIRFRCILKHKLSEITKKPTRSTFQSDPQNNITKKRYAIHNGTGSEMQTTNRTSNSFDHYTVCSTKLELKHLA